MWSDAYKLTGDTYDPSAGRALMEELAGEAYTPVAQAPVQQLPWYNNLGNNVGGFMNTLGGYASKLAPALASAGQVALKGSGANKTWGNAFGDLAQGLVSGKLGGNLTTSGVSKMAPSTPGAQARPVATPGDLNANGIPDVQEKVTFERKTTGGQAQQPSMSNIKQMDTTFSPGGYSKLPGLLSQGPKSFNEGSGVSTGSPESIVNAPVGEATPEERSNMLMYLGGMLGPEAALKMATDTATQRINEQKATAENLAAQASLQKAITDVNKFNWETSPAYIKYKGAIKQAEAMGDKVAEYTLNQQIISDAEGIPVEDPILRRYGNTYADLMKRFGTPKIDGVISSIISARARIEAAAMNAGATASAAKSMTDNQIALFLTAENNRLSRELNTNIVDLRNRQNSPGNIMLDDAGQKANQAEINRLQSNISKINEEINSNSLAAKGLMKGRVSIQSAIPSKGTRSTITVNGKNITGIMSPDGKTFTGDNGKVYNKK